jgi:serine phosphatase RsbU (regulator of sigma subunit)/anti-sigma regulatory factor (Ser/Thr protein kinase)
VRTYFGGGRATANVERQPHLVALVWASAVCLLITLCWLAAPMVPSPASLIILQTVTPTCTIAAAAVLALRARLEQDQALRWCAVGLFVAASAQLLQLIAFSKVSPGGGVFGSHPTNSSMLNLYWHVAIALGVLAGGFPAFRHWRRPALVIGVVIAVLLAQPWLAPAPRAFTHPDGWFTPLLIVLQLLVMLLLALAAVRWAERSGQRATAASGFVTVTLVMCIYDLLVSTVAHKAYAPLWWAAQTMRSGAFVVLLGGLFWSTARQLTALERSTRAELDRAEGEVASWTEVTERLLAVSRSLSEATTTEAVGEVLTRAGASAIGARYAGVSVIDMDNPQTLHLLQQAATDSTTKATLESFPVTDDLPSGYVVRRGASVFLETPEEIRALFPQLQQILPGTPGAALVSVPLIAGDSVVGALVVRLSEPRAFNGLEREMLSALGRQGGHALRHALLYERSRSVATTLQSALLPRTLPARPDLELVARYLPATVGFDVGGDWYDALEIDADRVMLVVGDVMGKGLRAATTMGQFRSAVRALACVNPEPASILDGLDRLAEGLDEDEIVTLTLVMVNITERTATVANAGHLPPQFVGSSGQIQPGSRRPSPPIGAPIDEPRHQETTPVGPGTSLLLLTDGLVEERDRDITDGLDAFTARAAQLLTTGRSADLEEIAEQLVGDAQGKEDDVTLLIARLPQADLRLRIAPEPGNVALVRQQVSARLAELTGRIDIDAVLLATSELVTNGIRHGQGEVDVRLTYSPGYLRLAVTDAGGGVPHREPGTDDGLGGRGLLLVDAVAGSWGVERHPTGGKTVWADFTLLPVQPHGAASPRPTPLLGQADSGSVPSAG